MTPTERLKRLLHEMAAETSPRMRLRLAAQVAHAGNDLLEEAGGDCAEWSDNLRRQSVDAHVDLVALQTSGERDAAMVRKATHLEAAELGIPRNCDGDRDGYHYIDGGDPACRWCGETRETFNARAAAGDAYRGQ